jgi:hypothetical protein
LAVVPVWNSGKVFVTGLPIVRREVVIVLACTEFVLIELMLAIELIYTLEA